MTSTHRAGLRRSMAVLVAVTATAGLAGCGGGGGDATATGPAPTAATSATATSAPSFTALANAVCRSEVADVPPVPDPGAPAAEGRRYAAAVERAARGLASAFADLERRRPESQHTLAPLVTKAGAVASAARDAATREGERAADVQDAVRISVARLNEASSADGLVGCSL